MSKYIGVRSHAINKQNPFRRDLFEMQVSTRTKVLAGNKEAINNMIVDKETGEVLGHQLLAVKQKVDQEQFTKIFHRGLAAMWGLTTPGIRVFTYVASKIKPNQDFVIFSVREAKEHSNYKRDKSIWQGVGELLSAGFLARSEDYYKYYINPTFFFNGSRLTLVNHYEVDPTTDPKTKDEIEQKQLTLKNQLTLELPPTEK